MYIVRLIISIIIIAIIVWLLTSTAVVVRQGEVKVVESFGKYVKTLEPGLHFLVPILYTGT
jgi:regulator of protease activity HflC (stomatin/prohibitin superfamily)